MTDVANYSYILTLTPQGSLEVNSEPVEVPPEHRAGRLPLFWAMNEVNRQHLACGGELSLTVYDELTGGGKLTVDAPPGQVVDLEDLLPQGTPRIRAREQVRPPFPPLNYPEPAPEAASVDTEPIPHVSPQHPATAPAPAPQRADPTLHTPPPVPTFMPTPPSKPPSPINVMPPASVRFVTTTRRPAAEHLEGTASRKAVLVQPQEPSPPPRRVEGPLAPRDAAAADRPAAVAVAAIPRREIVVRRRSPTQVATRDEPPSSEQVSFSWQRPDVVQATPAVPPPRLADRPRRPRIIRIPRRVLVVAGLCAALVGLGAGWVAFGQQGPPPHSAVCVEATSMTRVAAAAGGCEFPRRWWYVPAGQPIARVGQVVGVEGSFTLPTGEGARAATLEDDQPSG